MLFFADIVLSQFVHLTGISIFIEVWPETLFLFLCLLYCVLRPLPRLVETTELVIWSVLLSNALSPLVLIAGRSPRPLVDQDLMLIDRRMHISTEFFIYLVDQSHVLKLIFVLAYSSVGPLAVITILALPFFGYAHATRRFVLGTTLTLILSSAIFALWPAIGPWTTQSFRPTSEQIGVASYLMRLKSPGPVEVDLIHVGIISFPSFHVALAILCGVALGSFRRIRVWLWILIGLVCISTVTTGWHYGIDVLGGIVVAVVSIAVAGWILQSNCKL
jgi:membrane-associated phospholipid phosphatase